MGTSRSLALHEPRWSIPGCNLAQQTNVVLPLQPLILISEIGESRIVAYTVYAKRVRPRRLGLLMLL